MRVLICILYLGICIHLCACVCIYMYICRSICRHGEGGRGQAITKLTTNTAGTTEEDVDNLIASLQALVPGPTGGGNKDSEDTSTQGGYGPSGSEGARGSGPSGSEGASGAGPSGSEGADVQSHGGLSLRPIDVRSVMFSPYSMVRPIHLFSPYSLTRPSHFSRPIHLRAPLTCSRPFHWCAPFDRTQMQSHSCTLLCCASYLVLADLSCERLFSSPCFRGRSECCRG